MFNAPQQLIACGSTVLYISRRSCLPRRANMTDEGNTIRECVDSMLNSPFNSCASQHPAQQHLRLRERVARQL